MSISNYFRDCKKVVAGNYDKLFIANKDAIASITFDDKEVSAITMEIDKYFGIVEADIDDTAFTTEGTAEKGYYSEQELIAKFSKKTSALEAQVNEFIDGATCGLVIIRIDRQGYGWISGVADDDNYFANNPWHTVTESFNSGESIEDVDEGNRYTITFGRKSATREYKLTDALVDSLTKDQDAAFVDWPASE